MFGENPKRNFQKELDELKSNSWQMSKYML
jgi:hypothetical protein